MIIELVGLPGSGKTALAEAAKARGAVLVPLPSRTRLLTEALLFWLVHPLLALRVFFCLLRKTPNGMRYELFINGYLGYAARYRKALSLSLQGMTVVLDQGFFQMLISLRGLPPGLLEKLPRPDVLVAVVVDATERERRMLARGWAPRANFGDEHRLAWQREAEEAFAAALPMLEGLVRIYRYDGTRSSQEGAHMLMIFAALLGEAPTQASSVRNFVKTVFVAIAFAFARVARIFSHTPEVVVLMYHAVDRSGWKLAVSPEAFERQMRHLSERKLPVPVADIVSYAKGNSMFSARAVAVTFDDGYRDLLTTVLPILERYGIPATVFVPSDLSIQTDPKGRARLTEEELCELAKSPLITIGSHAKSHQKFTELSPEKMQSESEDSADELAHMLGKQPLFFAYPFGARSSEAEQAIERAGYEAAFGISEGTVNPGDALFRLKRVQVDSTMDFFLFRLRLTGAVDWNRRIVDSLRLMNHHA